MEAILTRAWGPIVPGCRWLHDPQPISEQPMGVGFLHRAGRCRPGVSPLPGFVAVVDVRSDF